MKTQWNIYEMDQNHKNVSKRQSILHSVALLVKKKLDFGPSVVKQTIYMSKVVFFTQILSFSAESTAISDIFYKKKLYHLFFCKFGWSSTYVL